MKTIIRITALTLSLVMLLGIAVGCDKKDDKKAVSVSFSEEIAPAPINASYQNKVVFMYNPDRGFRTDFVIDVGQYTQYVNDEEMLLRQIGDRFGGYFGKLQEPCHLAFAYIYMTDWNRTELSDEALKVIEGIFKYCRIKKYKLYVSFAYNGDYAKPWYNSEENRQLLDSVCADQDTILKHIDQLAPIVAEYKDCCFNIKNGFIGSYGEWAYPYQYPEVDYDVITKAIVDKLAAPNEIYFSHRLPRYTVSVKEKYPDWENVKWIGFNNCAFYGEQTNEGWASEKFQVGDKDGWWEYICKNAAYFPVTGEMYTSEALNRYNAMVTGKQAILELAHHRHVTLSFWHGNYDCQSQYTNVMETWKRQDINTNWLDAQGIIYDPNWFLDANGNTVIRTCYDFIRDHLGYKLVAENVKLNAADGKIKVDMAFKNYGFSAAFNLASGFAILDENYEPVTEVQVGDPRDWHSHDPDNWKSTEVLNHSLSAELDAPTSSGTYHVAFFLRNTQCTGAQLSNDVVFENNYNILYTFEA